MMPEGGKHIKNKLVCQTCFVIKERLDNQNCFLVVQVTEMQTNFQGMLWPFNKIIQNTTKFLVKEVVF